MNRNEEVIFKDDPRAAEQVNVQMWKSIDGSLFFDEHMARWNSSTATRCEKCGKQTRWRGFPLCDEHQSEAERKKWEELELEEWNGEPLMLYDDKEFFFSMGDLDSYCDVHGCDPSDLMLVICVSSKPGDYHVDSDTFVDHLGEDQEIDDHVWEAIEALNQAIKDSSPMAWAWDPGDTRPACFYSKKEGEE